MLKSQFPKASKLPAKNVYETIFFIANQEEVDQKSDNFIICVY